MHPTLNELCTSLLGLKKLATAAAKVNPVPKGAASAPRGDFRMARAATRLLDLIEAAVGAKADDAKAGNVEKAAPVPKAPRGIKLDPKFAPATGKARAKVGSIPVVAGMSPAEKRKATLAAKAEEAKKAEAAAKRKAAREAKAAAAAAQAAAAAAAAKRAEKKAAKVAAPAPEADPAVDPKAEKRAAFAARMKAAREAKKAPVADDEV